jgi:TetR/AcrR family transcriptional regulator
MPTTNPKPVTVRKAASKTPVRSAAKAAKPAKGLASGQEPKRRSGLSRSKILDVATKLFAQRGYSGVSIRDIAGACGIGIPSIYHFFGDKDNLYVTCCEQLFSEVEVILSGSFKEPASTHTHVRNFAIAICGVLLKRSDVRRLLQMELLQDEHRGIEEITAHHFIAAFQLLINGISELVGKEGATERAFLMYAIAVGQIQMQRVAQLAGIDVTYGGNPEKLAEHVLNVALPGHNWAS